MLQEIITKIQSLMLSTLNSTQLQMLTNTLQLELGNYNIARKDSSLVKYEGNSNLNFIKMFFTAKMVEGLSKKSINFYRICLNNFFSFVPKEIVEISSDDIRQYLAYKSIHCKVCNVSLNNYRAVLQSFFGWLQQEEHILRNPISKIKIIKVPKRILDPLSEAELEIVRNNCKNIRDKAIVELLYSTGIRVGELVRINREDIDYIDKSVNVIGKGDKERKAYLNARAIFTIQKYIATRTDNHPALFLKRNGHKQNDSRLEISGVEIILRKMGKELGIRLHPHKFRRTTATSALSRGMPINEVRKLLGHEKIDTTLKYANTSDESVQVSHKKYLV